MEQNINFFCTIYVDDDEIYSGDLSEVPEKFRDRIIGDIAEWADCLGKSGVNELLYSLLVWYEKKGLYCEGCDSLDDELETESCNECGGVLREKYLYDRSAEIDRIMTCIGMISKIEVSK